MNMEYKCEKCGSDKVYAKPNARRMGVYCAKCGEWIAWTNYTGMMELYKKIGQDDRLLGETVAMRYIKRYGGITTMRCSKCEALLYSSNFPKIKGQFDLVNASYCPKCGRELI